MGIFLGEGLRIVTDTITPGEIKSCRSCTAFAATKPISSVDGQPLAEDLEFMRMRHADHITRPHLYHGWPT